MSRSRPAQRVPRELIDLAAERDPGPISLDEEIVASAREHRLFGLLWSHLQRAGKTPLDLALIDLRIQRHQHRILELAEYTARTAAELDLRIALIKGIALEERFYSRAGERPSSDVDVLVAPDDLRRTPELVAALQPDHPWLPHLDRMIARRQVQSVTTVVNGMEVDVHLDVLKLGVWTRQSSQVFDQQPSMALPDGRDLAVLDDTWTLLLLLVHLNKDRFQRLLGYADIVRIVRHGSVDWDRFGSIVLGEGLHEVADAVLRTVETDLEVELPRPKMRVRTWRTAWWLRVWSPEVRLLGEEGRRRFRYRQNLIPLLARGRVAACLRWWVREVFPPAGAVAAEYPDVRGPYAVRLFRGRLLSKRQRTAQQRGADERGEPGRSV